MSVLARATVILDSDVRDLSAGLQLVQEEMQKAGKVLGSIGRELSLKVTLPLTALGAASVHAFGEQEDAIARLNAVLTATGNVAGTTTAEVLAMATSLQTTTRFADETVVAAAGLIATFQNVRNELGAGNDIFNRAVRNAADLAAVMGTDLSTAALQLGRALERDRGALDDHFRFLRARKKLLHHLLHVLPGRHHAEHDVARGELRQRADDFGAVLGERFGFGARAVPQRDVAAALRQARGHLVTHPPSADPAELHVLNRGWQSEVPLRDRAK